MFVYVLIGMAAKSAETIAESFVDAINDHQISEPSILDVRIIIFQPDVFQSFTNTIQKVIQKTSGKSGFLDRVKGECIFCFQSNSIINHFSSLSLFVWPLFACLCASAN